MTTSNELGRFIALILRHKPQAIGIQLDEHGWAKVDELIKGIQEHYDFSLELLEEIVRTDKKGRYSFNEDHTLIRANQGHSISVDVELKEAIPPNILYHGTAIKYVSSIENRGLISKNRLYVHLSKDIDTAINVGYRHGTPVIYSVNCKQMVLDGYKFYISVNGVWLTKSVPFKYLTKISI